jgi:hypothetical protein
MNKSAVSSGSRTNAIVGAENSQVALLASRLFHADVEIRSVTLMARTSSETRGASSSAYCDR